MQIEMIGIDYSSASLSLREQFSLTAAGSAWLAGNLRDRCAADGVVVVSTCNRTEVWASGAKISLWDGYFAALNLSPADCAPYFARKENRAAVDYLLELACGLHSQIFGEDQILTQLQEALRSARAGGLTDPVLETLFRTAFTAAKRVKTETAIQAKDRSVPERALSVLEERYGSLAGKRCLVIGNGEMGRLLCRLLVERGCAVTMTVRRYRHQETVVPTGCTAVPYDDRYRQIAGADLVFSATVSPHYTVKSSLLLPRENPAPLVLVDLAVPRDMEPRVGQLPGVTLYDMDQMGVTAVHNEAAVAQAMTILQEAADDFYRWQGIRGDARTVRDIGRSAAAMTNQKLTRIYQTQGGLADQGQVARAAAKTLEKLLFSLRDNVEPVDWSRWIDALRRTVEQWDQDGRES